MKKDINTQIKEAVEWARGVKATPWAYTGLTNNAAELIIIAFVNILEE